MTVQPRIDPYTGDTLPPAVDLERDFPQLAACRLALTHDWLTGFGGAERVLKVFAELFPRAPIYTSIYDSARFGEDFAPGRVHASFLQGWPAAREQYRNYLPLMPRAFASHNLRDFNLVLASTHAFSKAVRVTPNQRLVCYCYTPIRYLWGDLQAEYLATLSPLKRAAFGMIAPSLRRADYVAAQHVDRFIAISNEIAKRIDTHYGRESMVLYPPVFTDQWTPVKVPSREAFLIVSRFVPYKRVDLAVAACARLGLPLKVVGEGPEEAKVRAAAGGSKAIEFLGFVGEEALSDLYANARALIFTAHEDFGLAPLEANAAGTPVIAYAGGGALETVREGISGLFFQEQTIESLVGTLQSFKSENFDPVTLRRHALRFGREEFERRLCELLTEAMG